MALRANDAQTITGLPVFWQNAAEERTQEWERWIQLFEVAVMAKNSISLEKLLRDATHEARKKALMEYLAEATAIRKVMSNVFGIRRNE